jgi:hypothetical protein
LAHLTSQGYIAAVLCIVYSEYLKAIDVTRHARLLDRNAFLKKEANPIACRDPGRSVKAPTHVIKWPTGTQKSSTCVPTHPPHWRRESAVSTRQVGVRRSSQHGTDARKRRGGSSHFRTSRRTRNRCHEEFTKLSICASGQRQWFNRVKSEPFPYLFASSDVCFAALLNWTQSLQRKQNPSTKPMKKMCPSLYIPSHPPNQRCAIATLSFSMC